MALSLLLLYRDLNHAFLLLESQLPGRSHPEGEKEMARAYCLTSVKSACVLTALLLSMGAHATLSDCSATLMDSTANLDCSPAPAVAINTATAPSLNPISTAAPALNPGAHTEFQVGNPGSANAVSGTVPPLLVLISIFLIIVLLRAKRFNTK